MPLVSTTECALASRSHLTAVALLLAALPAAGQSQAWSRQLGTSASEEASAAAPDGSGGAYVTGWTGGSLGGPSAGGRDAWLVRFDGAGSQVWARQLGTANWDIAYAAATDGSGGVYLAGYTNGSLGGPHAGAGDAWLARYDGAGNQLWIRQLGTSADEYAYAAAMDGSGGVYLGGMTRGSLGGANAGDYDAWVARYDGAGNQLWVRQLGTSVYDEARAAAPDGSGGVYVAGRTWGDLGGPHAGEGDAWLARYDGAGNQLWVRQSGTSIHETAWTIAPDDSGGLYVGAYTDDSLGVPGAGDTDVWLARYDSAGNELWSLGLETGEDDFIGAAAPDGSGGVYVAGSTEGSLGGPSAGIRDVWLAHYDHAGDELWIHQFGTTTFDWAKAAAPDGSGGMFVGGGTDGSLGGLNAGSWDSWLARYDVQCGASTSYCTAKTTSTGCTPSIGWLGTPRKSGGPGTFDITLSDTRPNKPYICFYSVNTARNAAPFQGGLLCMQPPVRRTAVELTSNAGECASGASKDFGAILANASFISAGDVLRGEWWGRDTPGNSSLSDAIELTVCP